MMMHRTLSFVIAWCCCTMLALAQQAGVSGYVTDRTTGKGVRGVTVRVEGTRLGAITDADGKFRIPSVPEGSVVLATSCVGYEQQRVTIVMRGNASKDVVISILPTDVVTSDVVVSASKRVQAVQDVPISVATLRAADLDQRSITQLDEALTYVSGVTVARDQVNIRGASGFALGAGSRTAVLLDGFPLLSGDAGDIKFDVLPVADIDRIEIIKGAGSALYGTGALGGVVSLLTKDPTDRADISARLYGGVFTLPRFAQWQYRETLPVQTGADLRFAQRLGNVSVSVSGGYRTDESYRDFDAGHRAFGYGKLAWRPSDAATFTLFGLYAMSDKENLLYWKSLAEATRPQTDQDPNQLLFSSKLAVAAEWSHVLSGATSLVVRPGVYRTHFNNHLNGVDQDSNTSTATTYNVEAQLTSRLWADAVLTSGVNARLNDVSADVYGEQIQSVLSAYAQMELTLDTVVIVTAGLRADREETATLDPHFVLSPKLGLTWKLAERTALRASAGRGFRAATVAERYANIRYGPLQVIPNLTIRPEYSWSIEAGINHVWSDGPVPLDVDLAVFDNELHDMIEPIIVPSGEIQFLNVTRARVLGTELTLRAMLAHGLGVETGLTLMLPQDLTLDQTLKYRNNVLWYSRASWDVVDALTLQTEYRFMNRVERIDDLNVVTDYDARVPIHLVDTRIICHVDRLSDGALPLTASLIGKNVLDYYYTEVMGNLGPMRSVVLQLEYRSVPFQ